MPLAAPLMNGMHQRRRDAPDSGILIFGGRLCQYALVTAM